MITTTDISREARESNRPKAPVQRAAILSFIRMCGLHGASCDEAEVALGLPHQTCSARFKDLKDEGLIETLGEVRKTRTGSRAIVYIIKGKQ